MKALFDHWELYGVIFAGRLSIVTMHYHKLFTTEKNSTLLQCYNE